MTDPVHLRRRPLLAWLMLSSSILSGAADAATWEVGDVFVAVGNGSYSVYSNNGQFKQTLTSGLGGFGNDCAFDANGDLYTTDTPSNRVIKYLGVEPHPIVLNFIAAGPAPTDPRARSLAFDGATSSIFVGHDCKSFSPINGLCNSTASLHKYDTEANFLDRYTLVSCSTTGCADGPIASMEFSTDHETLFYVAGSRPIKRYNVVTKTQLPEFAQLATGLRAYGMRLLPPGDGQGGMLVAALTSIKRLNRTGAEIMTYDVPNEDLWYGLSLDSSATSFWAGGGRSGNLYRFNIATGAVEVGPIRVCTGSGSTQCMGGICVKRTAGPASPPTPTPTPARPRLAYYALGDSIASGHGLPGTVSSAATNCERSEGAYPLRVCRALQMRYGNQYQVSCKSFACSGARSYKFKQAGDYDPVDVPKQVSQFLTEVPQFPPDQRTIVSLTVGADDFDFVHELASGENICAGSDQFASWLARTSIHLQRQVVRHLEKLLAVPNVSVVLTDYPNPFNRRSAYFRLLRNLARFRLGCEASSILSLGCSLVPGFEVNTRCVAPGGLSSILSESASDRELYARVERTVGRMSINMAPVLSAPRSLNEALGNAASIQLRAAGTAGRLALVSVKDAFSGREAEPPDCGDAPLARPPSYIQIPTFGINVTTFLNFAIATGEFGELERRLHRGMDCIHPDLRGATAYAFGSESSSGVADAIVQLLESPPLTSSFAMHANVDGSSVEVAGSDATSALGECCSEHESPACASPSCSSCVCDSDSFCCDLKWDFFCADAAKTACAASCSCPTETPPTPIATPTPGGSCCDPHSGASCDESSCAACVCATDQECCADRWDDYCVSSARSECAASCACAPATRTPVATPTPGGPCCAVHGGPGCGNASCQACVCAADAACCDASWSEFCVAAAREQCAADCACAPSVTATATATNTPTPVTTGTQATMTPTPTPGDCCAAHPAPGCGISECEACVCALDAFCCDFAWDPFCVAHATAECAPSCGCAPTPTPTRSPRPRPWGDCDGDGAFGPQDLQRIVDIFVRCGTCDTGGVPAGGCDEVSGVDKQCFSADIDGDGCIRASELTRASSE